MKRWEVYLMAAGALLTAVFLVALFMMNEDEKAKHETKMQQIDAWTYGMVESSKNAGRALKTLRPLDLDALILLQPDSEHYATGLARMGQEWNIKKFRRCVELLPLLPQVSSRKDVISILQKNTGHSCGANLTAWRMALQDAEGRADDTDPSFASFKALAYKNREPAFIDYFGPDVFTTVKLSQVVWDGESMRDKKVLDEPQSVSAAAAGLNETDRVFGLKIGKDARAYPQKLMESHDVLNDICADTTLTCVFQRKPEAFFAYETKIGDYSLRMGDSGFAYKNSILLFDQDTKSLWLASEGKAAVGPMARNAKALKKIAATSTDWGTWKKLQPQTRVVTSFKNQF